MCVLVYLRSVRQCGVRAAFSSTSRRTTRPTPEIAFIDASFSLRRYVAMSDMTWNRNLFYVCLSEHCIQRAVIHVGATLQCVTCTSGM